MNTIDFSHAGGFPLETDTFDFLQKSLADPIKALATLGGDNYIISGVVETKDKVSDGWVVINGEILPFKGDFKQNTVIVTKTAKKASFENGTQRDAYFTHQAMFGAGLESIPFASMPRISDLQKQKKRADDLIADHETHKEHVVQRTGELQTAHDDLKDRVAKLEKVQFVRGMILVWSGSIDSIPTGWQLCSHLADKFILGAGGSYGVGSTGGEKEHQLTVNEMPEHDHKESSGTKKMWGGYGDSGSSLYGYRHYWNEYKYYSGEDQATFKTGGSQPHNNMPPYYALAYIEYVG